MSMSLKPRDTGVYASCSCGSRMFIPEVSALKIPVVFCPCGEITPIDKAILNRMTCRRIRSFQAQKDGRLYRPPSREERRRVNRYGGSGGIQGTLDFDFEPLV